MGWTHGIRRKMAFAFTLVGVMLVVLLGSIASLYHSYKRTVEDFEFSVTRAPRRADLAEPIGMLFQPLVEANGVPATEEAAREFHAGFRERLDAAHLAFQEFVRKCEKLPHSPAERDRGFVRGAFLSKTAVELRTLDRLVEATIDPRTRRRAHPRIMEIVARLQTSVQNMPDQLSGVRARLEADQDSIRLEFRTALASAVLVAITFVCLFVFGFRAILAPVKRLHEGARRVAQGKFDYEIPVHGRDEMADLAKAFNAMTARFREIRDELDREVDERSRQLVRSERLAGVGFLAAGVAHEINNPLSAISVAAESMSTRMHGLLADPDSEDGRECLEDLAMMNRESQRCGVITARLLDFCRGQDESRADADLGIIVDEVIAMVRPMKKFQDREIDVQREGDCVAEVHGGEMKQVVLNLVANALESMDPGGRLAITLDSCPDRIAMTFRDTGCGMTPEVQQHLFEPFFTRRRGGKGTGLGLAITNRIVQDHGGSIEASSDGPGRGSTFRVVVPRQQPNRQAAA